MAYREGRSPYDVAFEIWIEAQSRESQVAAERANAVVHLARMQGELEIAWARHGAATALERHLNALRNAASMRNARPDWLDGDLAKAEKQAEEARAAIQSAEAELALAREKLQAAIEVLGDATRARMTAETEVRKLAPK